MVKLSPQHQDILASLIAREQDGSLNSAVFSDLPIEVYHHPQCPGVSSTRIKDIVARNYNYARRATFTPTPAMEFGTKFHEWMEDHTAFLKKYTIGSMGIGSGRSYCSLDDYNRLNIMSQKVKEHPEAQELYEGAKFEWTFFARCPQSGVLRKARPDILKHRRIGDWKTTVDASPAAFAKTARRLLYRISCIYYCDVVTAASGHFIDPEDFRFIAVESDGMHDVAVYPVSLHSCNTARLEIDAALSAIARSHEGGWTGYDLAQPPITI